MSDVRGRFWLCPKCGKHVPARQAECRCGFSRAGLAEVAFEAVGVAGPSPQVAPAWFAVGPTKLVVMSLATLGFYQIYWFSLAFLTKVQPRAEGSQDLVGSQPGSGAEGGSIRGAARGRQLPAAVRVESGGSTRKVRRTRPSIISSPSESGAGASRRRPRR